MNCKIYAHIPTDDGESCECGYFVKTKARDDAYKQGYIDAGIEALISTQIKTKQDFNILTITTIHS